MITPMTALVAAGPVWTDKLTVGITTIGVLGGVAALWLSLQQLRLQTHELASQTAQDKQALDIRMAQRALQLMQMLADLGRVVVEYPELAPYFHTGKELPTDEVLRNRVLAHASGYMSLAEATGWQIKVDQMSGEAAYAWQEYFSDFFATTPALQRVVADNLRMLSGEALWLFGREPTEAVLRLDAPLVADATASGLVFRDGRSG